MEVLNLKFKKGHMEALNEMTYTQLNFFSSLLKQFTLELLLLCFLNHALPPRRLPKVETLGGAEVRKTVLHLSSFLASRVFKSCSPFCELLFVCLFVWVSFDESFIITEGSANCNSWNLVDPGIHLQFWLITYSFLSSRYLVTPRGFFFFTEAFLSPQVVLLDWPKTILPRLSFFCNPFLIPWKYLLTLCSE